VIATTNWVHVAILVVLFALWVLALVQTWRSRRLEVVGKTVWTLIIVLIPVVGELAWLIWWLATRTSGKDSAPAS
jgi:uncharacterized membrane protein YhaH (DUF805 family)